MRTTLSAFTLALAAIFTTIPATVKPANAECNCPAKPALKRAFKKSDVVLVGRVEEQKTTPLKPGYMEVTLTILKKFKDDKEMRRDFIVIYTKEGDCGVVFQPGFEYLIFAAGNPAFYTTSSCGRTEVLENAQVDLHRLIKLSGRLKI